jgi:hypothetical protein
MINKHVFTKKLHKKKPLRVSLPVILKECEGTGDEACPFYRKYGV